MSNQRFKEIGDLIRRMVSEDDPRQSSAAVARHGLDALPVLEEALSEDRPIEELERFEMVLKVVLNDVFSRPVSIESALRIARFQKEIGLACKYKSYSIKATTPLGYAIFLQNDGEGFSFQRHVTHKTEVFHIVQPHSHARVFLCPYKEWERIYDAESFEAWLAGEPGAKYEQFSVVPEAGDVFVIDQLNVVHAVLGCVLEEYATVSTDMVDQLHNQNAGRPIPERFNREYAAQSLRRLSSPVTSRQVQITPEGIVRSDLVTRGFDGGNVTTLAEFAITAERYIVDGQRKTPELRDTSRASSLYMWSGEGELVLGDGRGSGNSSLQVSAGDSLMIPPGTPHHIENVSAGEMIFSRHRIPHEVAFHGIPGLE